ncbi:MAG: acyltransferase family protein [Rickettsia endosymbiont of Pentastiridius leporinus]
MYNKYYNNLDVLRGLACLLVYFSMSHLPVHVIFGCESSSIVDAANGVYLFFVISGFIITESFDKNFKKINNFSLKEFLLTVKENRERIYNFWYNRCIRLGPALCLSLTCCALLMLRFGVKNHNIFAAVESLIRYIIGFILLDNIVADWSSPLANFRVILVGVTWSLTCEILFYLIFPFIIVFSKLKSILPLLVIGTFIINIYSGSNAVYFSEFGHFDAFFLGILISFYNKQVNIKSKVLIFLYILSLAIIFFISPRTTGKGSDYLHVLLACGFLVYSVTLNRDIINLSFVGKLLSFIGRRSYFIYLMHLTIAYVMRKPLNYLFTYLANYSLYLKKLILKDTKILHIQNIIIFFIIIICADLFYRYIEQPFIKKYKKV